MHGTMSNRLKTLFKKSQTVYRAALFLYDRETRVQWFLRKIVNNPGWHCRYLVEHSIMYGYGTIYPRSLKINLREPKLFNEKLLWLKYYQYNEEPLIARCYDKYLVRGYVKECNCGNILNELYGVWDSVDDVPWSLLPENCILKITNGCGNHVFKKKGMPLDIAKAKTTLREALDAGRKGMVTSGDLFATKMPQKIICERLIESNAGYSSPEDYKFYCFHGEPAYLLYIWDRYGKGGFKETFKNSDLSDRSEFFRGAKPITLEKPACYNEMLDICRKLSKPFPFVRVDLYVNQGNPVFGELTFTPAGGHVLYHVYKNDNTLNLPALQKMGEQIHL
jgi:hypothetical protein